MLALAGTDYFLANINKELEIDYQPVKLDVIGKAEKGISKPVIVSIDGTRKGFLKNTVEVDDSDDLEWVVNCIGSRMGVKMAEEYRVLSKKYKKIGLLSVSVIQDFRDTFLEMRKVQTQILDSLKCGQKEMESWMTQWLEITKYPAFPELEDNREYQCKSKEDSLAAITLGLRYVQALYPKRKEAYQMFREDYFRMILFDLIIGQTDRTLDNYGVIFHSAEKNYELAPLFDNATLQKPYLAWEQYSLNGMIMERKQLSEVLFESFGDEMRMLAEPMLAVYETQKEIFAKLAEERIENKSKDVLIRKMEEGYQILKAFCCPKKTECI